MCTSLSTATRLGGALALAVLAGSASAQAPAPQIIMHGQAARAASMTDDVPGARAVYVFWDPSEGRLVDLLPPDATLTLTRDGATVLTFAPGDVASEAEIRARYDLPTEARRRAETLAILDEAFETGGESIPGVPADLDPTVQTFPTGLRQVLADPTLRPAWQPVTDLLARLDPNVAFAARRAWIEPVTTSTPATLVFRLMMNGVIELGRIEIATAIDFQPAAPSGLAAVTDGLFRCDSTDWSRAHGAVALTWDHPGLGPQPSVVAAMLASVPLAGYDLFAKAGPCEPQTDLAALARASDFDAAGRVTLAGWRRVKDQPTFIASPAPTRQPAATAEYLSTWQPRFAQAMELAPDLGALGLLPGDALCYAVAARDRTGNYGETATLSAAIGDFRPPEIPWSVSAITQASLAFDDSAGLVEGAALYIEWPHIDVDGWLFSHGTYYTPCNEAEAKTGAHPGRLVIAKDPTGCSDPTRRDELNLDVASYLVYRFATPHEANAFSDADGDGLADREERLFDTNGDRVGDTPESSVPPGSIGLLPASDPGAACTPSQPSAGFPVVIAADQAIVGADGRRVLRFSDTVPTQSRGEGYWYRIAARASNGRLSPLSPPIRASFPDMTKPEPFDVGPGGDAGFFACEPTMYQDDSPPDMLRDVSSPQMPYEPVLVDPDPDNGDRTDLRLVMGIDATDQAVAMRVRCLDERLVKYAEDSQDPALIQQMVAMRLLSYVGTLTDARRLKAALRDQLPSGLQSLPEGTRLIWAGPEDARSMCGALTKKAFGPPRDWDPASFYDVTQQCTPYVELLDAEGRALGPPQPMAIRADGSRGVDDASCDANPLAEGCELYACNWMATFEAELCERPLEPYGNLVTGKIQMTTQVARGECAYVEVEQEFPIMNTLGQRVDYEYQPYRLGWQCCDQPSCTFTQDIEPGDLGADNACYSVTRVHNTASGAKNTMASTRTAGPCAKRLKATAKARTPAPPSVAEVTTDAARMVTLLAAPAPTRACGDGNGGCVAGTTCTPVQGVEICACPAGRVYAEGACVDADRHAALLWTAPEEPIGGIVVEYWKDGAATAERKTVFLTARGRYGKANPKMDALDLGAVLPAGATERWCVVARSVGLSEVDKQDPSSQLSNATAPLCIERRAAGVAPPEYLPWPEIPLPGLLGTVKVDYLAADGVPFVSLGALDGMDSAPTRIRDASAACGNNPLSMDECGCSADVDDCGCRPSFACDPRNPENACLARPEITQADDHPDVDQDVYSWPDNSGEVTSRCLGFCADILAKNGFTDVVAYRRSRSHDEPADVTPFVQVSEYIVDMGCFFSRQQFRQWRPLAMREGPRRYGSDDPNFAVIDFQRDAFGLRSMELVWLDRHPHQDGRDYQYQFVFFDERGEIAGYKESNWLVYRHEGVHHVWTPEGEQ